MNDPASRLHGMERAVAGDLVVDTDAVEAGGSLGASNRPTLNLHLLLLRVYV